MGRKAEVHLRTGWSYSIETDIPQDKARDVAPRFDDYAFAFYYEDELGHFAGLYQPFGSVKGIDRDIESLKRNKKPAVDEIFEAADIIDEESGEVFAELDNVDLFGILEGVQKAMRDYKAEI